MYRRITEVRNPKKAELHDHLCLHDPLTDSHATFCKSCGMPIFTALIGKTSYQVATEPGMVVSAIETTERYNKYALKRATRCAEGAYFVAKNIRRTDRMRKLACKLPEYAYKYALDIDHAPHPLTRERACEDAVYAVRYAVDVDQKPSWTTWKAVIDYDSAKCEYLRQFGLSESELIDELRHGENYHV